MLFGEIRKSLVMVARLLQNVGGTAVGPAAQQGQVTSGQSQHETVSVCVRKARSPSRSGRQYLLCVWLCISPVVLPPGCRLGTHAEVSV